MSTSHWLNKKIFLVLLIGVLIFFLGSLAVFEEKGDKKIENPHAPSALAIVFEKMKQEFQNSLGLQDVSTFYEVEFAKAKVEKYEKINDEEKRHKARTSIMNILQTPKMRTESMTSNRTFQPSQLKRTIDEIMSELYIFQPSMQSYWEENTSRVNWNFQDYLKLQKAERGESQYEGKSEVSKTLKVMTNQGYRLALTGLGGDSLNQIDVQVIPNYEWIYGFLPEGSRTQFIRDYLQLLNVIQPQRKPLETQQDWVDLWPVLNRIEIFTSQYKPRNITAIYQRDLLSNASVYLDQLVTFGLKEGEKIPDSDQKKFKKIITQNDDSAYSDFLRYALDSYQTANWKRISLEQARNVSPVIIEGKRK